MVFYYGTDEKDEIDQGKLKLPDYSRIYSQKGDDVIIVSYAFVQGDEGNDIITDLTGSSIMDYYASPKGIVANLHTGVVSDGYGTRDTLIGFHEIQGSNFSDSIYGSLSSDRFSLNKGDDFLDGQGGFDLLYMFYSVDNYTIKYYKDYLTIINKDPNASDSGLKTIKNIGEIRFDGLQLRITPSSNDWVNQATASNDKIFLGYGDFSLNGISGNDSIIFTTSASNYKISLDKITNEILVSNENLNDPNFGVKKLTNISKIIFDARFDYSEISLKNLFPEINNTADYKFKRDALPDLQTYYHWAGWNTASVAVNSVLTPDINNDGKADIVAQLWQRVTEGGMATDLPTPNRLLILESQPDGTYKDTTSMRFNTSDAVVLGGSRGGVGLADFADVNHDGIVDFVFALNRDDGRLGTTTSGDSYATAIISKAGGTYEIQNLGEPVWNYFTQLVNINGNYQAWFSTLGYNVSNTTFGSYPNGWVDGSFVYQYDATSNKWSSAPEAPIRASFNVLPEFISGGKVSRIFTMLTDSSQAFDPTAGVAYQVPYAALMDQNSNGQWRINSSVNPFNYSATQFKLDGQVMMGHVGFDGENYFSLIEYFYRPGSFEIYPNSGHVVMATRSFFFLEKNITTGEFIADPHGSVKLDFFGIKNDQIYQLPIKIIDMQYHINSWAYSYIDINNDGLVDIAQQGWDGVDQTGGGPNVYLNTGAGVFVRLDPSVFPKAPEDWNKPAMSQFLDANGDGIYDLLYFPAYAEAQYISDTNWRLYEGVSALPTDTYKNNIEINDRLGSPLIRTWAGDDTISGIDIHNGINLIDTGAGNDVVRYLAKSTDFSLTFDNQHFSHVKNNLFDDVLKNVEKIQFSDRIVIIESKDHGSYADLPTELYQFFITAFNAAPGVTYMDQLAEAYRYGLSVKQIVDIFTTKKQFTDVYAPNLSHADLATQLVNNIVKNSASDTAKNEAIADIKGALDLGWTVGDVIYTVFGNLAHKDLSDPNWGNTAKQFNNQITVAKYYTEVLNQSTTDLETLRDAIQPVTQATDVSSDVVIAQIVGVALMTGGLGPGP
jgi:hypothetical protein